LLIDSRGWWPSMPRPRLNPTDEQRRLVKSLAAFGTPHEEICNILNIRSPKTLRKHFRAELDRGAAEANSNVARTLYKMATSGEHQAATFFWLKCRAGWKERRTVEPIATAAPPFVVAKEQGGQLR
jgi:hypothetical protein